MDVILDSVRFQNYDKIDKKDLQVYQFVCTWG